MSGFGKILEIGLLAGSAAYAKGKREDAKRAEEAKLEAEAKAARTEVLRLEDDKERIRRDENAFRIRWQSPDGVFGEKLAGSPTMIPDGSSILSKGSIKNGFKKHVGESVIETLLLDRSDGQFRTQLELEQLYGPRAATMYFPQAGQRVDGKDNLINTDQIRLAASSVSAGTSGAKRKVDYIVGKTRYKTETEAFNAHRENGFTIRRVTNTTNAFGEHTRDERDITGPGKDKGDEYSYVVLPNNVIVKRKDENALLEHYPKEQIQKGQFVGDVLLKQNIKAPSERVVTEYGAEDGKKFSNKKTVIRDDDPSFTEEDIKKAGESRLLEVKGPLGGEGTTYSAKGTFTAMPTQSQTAKQKAALDLSKFTSYIKLPNDQIIGGLDAQDDFEKLDSVFGKTIENMNIIKTGTVTLENGTKVPIGHQWIDKFGPLVIRSIKEQKKLMGGDMTEVNTVGVASEYILRKQGRGKLLEIPGMKAYLHSIDMEGNEAEALRIQTSLRIGENPDATVVVSREPITAENNEILGTIISGTVVGPKYKSLIEGTIMPLLERTTNDRDLALNTLSTYIVKERDPITLQAVQRPDGLGPVASQNQVTLDLFGSMSTTIIVSGGDGKLPVTELDLFEAFINDSGDGRSKQVLAAMSSTDKKAMANKFTEALDGDTEAGIMLVRGLVNSLGSKQMKLLKNKFGFTNGAADQRARLGYKAKYDSAIRAKKVGISALRTMINPDGSLRKSSTVVSFDQTVDGFIYYGQEIGKRIRGLAKDGVQGTSFGRQFLASTASRVSSNSGVATSTQFSNEALQTFENKFNQIAQEVAAATNQEKRLDATRKFHLTVLAYELAATIQGGTGGRTISDQDVQLIFSSLNQDFATTPLAQAASIQAAIAMIDEIRVQSLYLQSKDVKNNAAVAIANELKGTASPLVSISMSLDDGILAVTNRLGQLNPRSPDAFDAETGVSPTDVLNSVNLRLRMQKKPEVDSIEAAKELPEYQLTIDSLNKQRQG